VKDALERELHKLVCAGQLDLKTAQSEIVSNWIEANKKYLGSSPFKRPKSPASFGRRLQAFRQTLPRKTLLRLGIGSQGATLTTSQGGRHQTSADLEQVFPSRERIDTGLHHLVKGS
jgi:hypothetical protein